MALTDRHFIAEHFDILFAIFGLVVQKLCHFKVHIHFLLFVLIPEICTESFFTGRGLTIELTGGAAASLACHVGQRPTGRFDRRWRPGTARRGAVADGGDGDR